MCGGGEATFARRAIDRSGSWQKGCVMSKRGARVAVWLLLVLWFVPATGQAQLFKKAAQRRAARQGAGSSGSTQPPKTGLFGKPKQPKTGGLLNRNSQPVDRTQPKTGLFGKPKEPKSGGLFHRNKGDVAGPTTQKSGLFGKRRGAASSPYASYNQQQRNQQAAANSVQRSQRVSASEPLFAARADDRATSSADTPAVARSSPERARGDRPGDAATPGRGDRSATTDNSAIVRTRPKVPQRTQPAARVPHQPLKNTSQDLPVARPTSPLAAPPEVRSSIDILA